MKSILHKYHEVHVYQYVYCVHTIIHKMCQKMIISGFSNIDIDKSSYT